MKKFATIIIISAIIFSACQQHRALSDAIAAADAVVCTAPDSALAILARANTTDAPARLLAHYTLLTEKASDKADIVHTDDSLITAAARYYEGRNDSLEAQALYYKGVVQFNNRDFERALISLMQAHEVADNANDRFYKAMSSRTLSDVYNKLLAFDAAARCDSMAIVEFYEAGRPNYAMIEEIYLPYYYIQSGRFKEADSILDQGNRIKI